MLFLLVATGGVGVAPVLATSRENEIQKVKARFLLPRSLVVFLVMGDEAISIFIDSAVTGSIQADRAPNSFPQSSNFW